MEYVDALHLVIALALSEIRVEWDLIALIAGSGFVAGAVSAWLAGALWRRIR